LSPLSPIFGATPQAAAQVNINRSCHYGKPGRSLVVYQTRQFSMTAVSAGAEVLTWFKHNA
jgi:hypothetical protein